jgi:uncharacterized protein YjaZ
MYVDLNLLPVLNHAFDYLDESEYPGSNLPALWQTHMIDPFWGALAQWAPFDLSHMKPTPITDLNTLRKQTNLLSQHPLGEWQQQFAAITQTLPKNDEDPILVAIYPLCDSNTIVKQRQNGVVGACVFGNIIIQVNPLAHGYAAWIPYVFAHEYHHSVWGHHWYGMRGGQDLEGSFLEYMLNEGQADWFAESLFPTLQPQWNRLAEHDSEEELWAKLKPVLFSKDPDLHNTFMFGDEAEGLPWCVGYVFGRLIVGSYLQANPSHTPTDLLHTPTRDILQGSRFKI